MKNTQTDPISRARSFISSEENQYFTLADKPNPNVITISIEEIFVFTLSKDEKGGFRATTQDEEVKNMIVQVLDDSKSKDVIGFLRQLSLLFQKMIFDDSDNSDGEEEKEKEYSDLDVDEYYDAITPVEEKKREFPEDLKNGMQIEEENMEKTVIEKKEKEIEIDFSKIFLGWRCDACIDVHTKNGTYCHPYIMGAKYDCSVCKEYNMCEKCYPNNDHPHKFTKNINPKNTKEIYADIIMDMYYSGKRIYCEHLDRIEEAESILKMGLKFSEKLKDIKMMIRFLQKLAEIRTWKGDFPVAEKILNQCISISLKTNNKKRFVKCAVILARNKNSLGEIEVSEKLLKNAWKNLKYIKSVFVKTAVVFELVALLKSNDRLKEASGVLSSLNLLLDIPTLKKKIDLDPLLHDKVYCVCGVFYMQHGYIQMQMGHFEESLKNIQLGHDYFKKLKDVAVRCSKVSEAQKAMGQIYRSTSQYQKANEFLEKAMIGFKRLNYTEPYCLSCIELISSYHCSRDSEKLQNLSRDLIKNILQKRNLEKFENKLLELTGKELKTLSKYELEVIGTLSNILGVEGSMVGSTLNTSFEISEKYFKLSLLCFQNDQFRSCEIFITFGKLIFGQIKDSYLEAEKIFMKGYEIAKKIGSVALQIRALSELSSCCCALRDGEKAIQLYQRCLDLVQKHTKNRMEEINIRFGIANSYKMLKQSKKCTEQLEIIVKIFFEVSFQFKKKREVVNYFHKYQHIIDSLIAYLLKNGNGQRSLSLTEMYQSIDLLVQHDYCEKNVNALSNVKIPCETVFHMYLTSNDFIYNGVSFKGRWLTFHCIEKCDVKKIFGTVKKLEKVTSAKEMSPNEQKIHLKFLYQILFKRNEKYLKVNPNSLIYLSINPKLFSIPFYGLINDHGECMVENNTFSIIKSTLYYSFIRSKKLMKIMDPKNLLLGDPQKGGLKNSENIRNVGKLLGNSLIKLRNEANKKNLEKLLEDRSYNTILLSCHGKPSGDFSGTIVLSDGESIKGEEIRKHQKLEKTELIYLDLCYGQRVANSFLDLSGNIIACVDLVNSKVMNNVCLEFFNLKILGRSPQVALRNSIIEIIKDSKVKNDILSWAKISCFGFEM